jgi:TonB family protein
MADPEGADEDKTRIVTARDLPLRTGTNTISAPTQPALAPVEPETAPESAADATFESRLPSSSMREHEVAVTRAREEVDDDRGSRLPLIIGGIAIAAVIGGAWALINWLNSEIAVSRRKPPAVVPVPTPSSAPVRTTESPVVVAAAPTPAPPPVTAPVPASPPAAIAPPSRQAEPAASAPAQKTEPVPPVQKAEPAPAMRKPEPVAAEKTAHPPATAAPTSEARATPANTPTSNPTSVKPAAAPPQIAAVAAAPPPPTKSGPRTTANETRPASASSSAAYKSGPPAPAEPARARPPTPQNSNVPYTPPETAAAPPVSVPTVATVDARPQAPAPMAALDPQRAVTPPSTMAALKAISRPQGMFPAEAVRAGVDKGRVLARLFVAPDGTVSKVEIVSAYPVRVFDREVRETAMRWRYEPPGQARQAEVEFVFDRYKDR